MSRDTAAPVGVSAADEDRSTLVYLQLFSSIDVAALGDLISEFQLLRTAFVQRWHDLYASRFGAHRQYSVSSFRDAYLPYLRAGVVRLTGGDVQGFIALASELGTQLATRHVPFAVLVAHLSLLRESCIDLLMRKESLMRERLLAIDKIAAACISAAADGYYRRSREALPTAAEIMAERRHPPRLGPMRDAFCGMVGRSLPMRRLFEHIQRVATSAVPILIVGETGTGKELIARAIHHSGPRAAKPFVAINCAALPRDLIESELFGHVRGAFSGAATDHIGLFRAAAGGTLLLDEITEMSPELQAKLLRVLQERTVRPVGTVAEVPIDVRIIASTNREPAAVLEGGLLRNDLYYRLSVASITVPPLRERRDDIVALVENHLAALNERHRGLHGAIRGITSDAMTALLDRPWPGNVRELFNVIESAFATSKSLHIRVEDLGLPASHMKLAATMVPAAGPQTLAASERALIAHTLTVTHGNKRQAAQLLGISRKKLYAKIAKYSLTN